MLRFLGKVILNLKLIIDEAADLDTILSKEMFTFLKTTESSSLYMIDLIITPNYQASYVIL